MTRPWPAYRARPPHARDDHPRLRLLPGRRLAPVVAFVAAVLVTVAGCLGAAPAAANSGIGDGRRRRAPRHQRRRACHGQVGRGIVGVGTGVVGGVARAAVARFTVAAETAAPLIKAGSEVERRPERSSLRAFASRRWTKTRALVSIAVCRRTRRRLTMRFRDAPEPFQGMLDFPE